MTKTGILAALLFALAVSSVFAASMPKGAFLSSSVGSVAQLTQQVIDDPIVAARYAKHFCTSRNNVVAYFQENLKIGRLTKDLECTVYEITDRTDSVPTHRILRQGTRVFVGADGRAMLELSSGNPLTGTMPEAVNAKPDKVASTAWPSQVEGTSGAVVTKVLGAPAVEVGAGAPAIAATSVVDPSVEVIATTPIGQADAASIRHSNNSAAMLGVAALVGGLAMAGGGGGESASRSQPDSGPSPVPEPAGMTILLAGAVGLVLYRIRRQ